jgi:hypothetical protein
VPTIWFTEGKGWKPGYKTVNSVFYSSHSANVFTIFYSHLSSLTIQELFSWSTSDCFFLNFISTLVARFIHLLPHVSHDLSNEKLYTRFNEVLVLSMFAFYSVVESLFSVLGHMCCTCGMCHPVPPQGVCDFCLSTVLLVFLSTLSKAFS